MRSIDNRLVGLLLAVLATFVVLAPAVNASAEEDQAVKKGGPIVRHKILYRSTRFEIAPVAGMTLNDPFRRNIIAGVGLRYHLTNEFAIGASGGYGLLHPSTDLANNIEAELRNNNKQDKLANLSFSQIQWLAAFTLAYVPIFGKFSFLKVGTIPYDFHISGGFSLVNQTADTAVSGGNVDPEVDGLRPGGLLGGGVRLFLSDMISLNVDLNTLFISQARLSGGAGSATAKLRPTMYGTVGVGIFFPSTVKISR